MSKLLVGIVALTLSAACLSAQLTRGSLTGNVTDASGAAIAGARVVITSPDIGLKQETVTSGHGQYSVPNLPVGTYRVTVEAPGFKQFIRENIELGVSATVRVDAGLQVGNIAERIEVTSEAPRLQTDVPEVGTTLDSKQLVDLPLAFGGDTGRLPEAFAYKIMPGVSGDTWRSAVNGAPNFSKETLVDGASVSTYLSGHFGESSVSVEAVSEMKVQSSGISAEYGRTMGGVFNYALKSGSNQLHGSAYGGLRNEALNANSFSSNAYGRKRDLDRRFTYAGSLGGPVYLPKIYDGRNKTFFYTTYEKFWMTQRGLGTPSQSIPVPEFYQGDFSRLLGAALNYTDALGRQVYKGAIYDPATFRQVSGGRWVADMFAGNKIPVSRFSQVAKNMNAIASKYVPAIKDPDGQYALQNNNFALSTSKPEAKQFMYSVKGDHNIDDRQRLSASYSWTLRPRLRGGNGGFWDNSYSDGGPLSSLIKQEVKSQLARISHDYTISPTMLNHVIVSYNRLANTSANANAGVDGASLLGIKNLSTNGFPVFDWGGGPYYKLANPGEGSKSFGANLGWGFQDTISFSRGRHFMKAGIDIRRNHANNRPTQGGYLAFNARGTAIPNEVYSGTNTGYAFASYLLGIVDNATLADPVGLGGRRSYYAMFFQDDFKVSSRFTLQLGLRWEYQPPVTEVANRYSSWSPLETDPLSGLKGAYQFAGDCKECTGKNYFGVKKPFRDFGPRIGFAYNAAHGFTVRGAYGIFYADDLFNGYDPTPLGKATNTHVGGTWMLGSNPTTPWTGIFNLDQGFRTDLYAPGGIDRSWGDKNKPGMVDPNYGVTPYSQQWNLNIQKQIPGHIVLDLGYVGNKSTGLRNGSLYRLNQLEWSYVEKYGRSLTNTVKSASDAAQYGIAYPYPGFSGTLASALRQYPQVRSNDTVNVAYSPLGFGDYHSMQVTANRQFRSGLTMFVNYVWAKSLTNTESNFVSDNSGPLDFYNLKLEKAVSSDDVPHTFKGLVDYQLPFGKGKRLLSGANPWVNALIGGWNTSVIVNYASGTPLGFGAPNPLPNGWNGGNRANVAAGDLGNPSFDKSAFQLVAPSAAVNTYLNKSKFADPGALRLGTSALRYAQIRGFGVINEDITLQKTVRIRERYRFQVRADLLDAFNRYNLSGPNTDITSPLFGQVTGVGGNRQVQLGARLDF